MSFYGQVLPTGGTLSEGRRGVKRPRPRSFIDSAGNNLGVGSKRARMAKTRVTFRRKRKSSRRWGRGRRGRVPYTWPRSQLVKFKVVSTFQPGAQGAPGSPLQYLLMANSLSDPHGAILGVGGAGTSNLPLGLDQWAAMYRKYVVVSSTHFVKIHNVSSTGAIAYGLTLRQPNEASLFTSIEEYLESPMTRSRILSTDADHSGVGIHYNAKRYWHTPKLVTKENLHGELSTAPGAPEDIAYVSLWTGDLNKTEGYTAEGLVTSIYTCLLMDPIQPSRSIN